MADTKIKSSNITGLAVTHDKLHTDMNLTSKTVQVATPTADAHPATKGYVDTEVANLIDSAPGTLDTLNELAAAIGDDANFAATVTTGLSNKLPLAGGTMTGVIAGFESTGIDDNAANTSVTILSDGKVGIGIESPVRTLDVDSGTSSDIARFGNDSGAYTLGYTTDLASIDLPSSAGLRVRSGSTLALQTTSTGHVGIGTSSPTSAIDVRGEAVFGSGTDGLKLTYSAGNSTGIIDTGFTSTGLEFRTGNSFAAIIDSSGNVGIGASSPTSKLQVDGTVTATAFSGDGSALSGVGFTGFPTNATDLASPSEGDAYYNTTDDVVKFYTGSSWIPLTGTINRYDYTATANQTTFAAIYSDSNVDVYLNGIKLVATTDYTASNGTSVVMTSGVEADDLVNIVAQTSSFSISTSVPATGGTFTGNVILSGASTNLTVGNTVESSNLRLTNTGDLTMAGTGHAFQIGPTSARNLAMDNNEIMARNNGVGAELHLNPDGGDVTINNQGALSSGSKLVVRNRIELGDSTNANTKPTALLHIHKNINTGSSVTLAEAPSIVISENEIAGAGNQGYHGAYWFGSQDTNTPSDFNWYVAGMASQGGDTGGSSADGNLEFYTTNAGSSPTNTATLSQSGRWSVPAQPAFEMIRTTNIAGTGFLNSYCTYDSVTFETGGTGASTSSGQYTAPVDGLYHFSYSFTASGGDAGDDSFGAGFIISNNSYYNQDYASTNEQRFNPRFITQPGVENTYSVQKTARLSAGAKVGFYIKDWDTAAVIMEHAEFSGFKFA